MSLGDIELLLLVYGKSLCLLHKYITIYKKKLIIMVVTSSLHDVSYNF